MQAHYEFNISRDDYVRSMRVLSMSMVALDRRKYRSLYWQIGTVLVVAAICWALYPYSLDAIILTLVLLLSASCFQRTAHAKRWWGLLYDASRTDVALTFDGRGIRRQQGDIDTQYGWDSLRQLHDLPENVILQFSDWHGVPMPANLWPEPQQRAQFIEEVRTSASNLSNDPAVAQALDKTLLLRVMGAAAFGLIVMIAATKAIELAGWNDCSCEFRYSRVGQLLDVAPLLTYFVTIPLGWWILKWVERRSAKFADAIAIAFIVAFVCTAVPSAIRIARFFAG